MVERKGERARMIPVKSVYDVGPLEIESSKKGFSIRPKDITLTDFVTLSIESAEELSRVLDHHLKTYGRAETHEMYRQ